MALLIGISGKARSGKDTVAAMIERALPGIHRTNFSHAITEEYDTYIGTKTRHNEDEKVLHRPGIAALAEKRRAEDPQYWVTRTLSHEGDMLVAGVRSVGEAEAIRARGGILIRVEIDPKKLRARLGPHAQHLEAPNERYLDSYSDWDFILPNNGTLEDLEKEVGAVIKKILE